MLAWNHAKRSWRPVRAAAATAVLRLGMGCIAALLPAAVEADTLWPPGQASLWAGPSASELKARLPANLAVAAPEPEAPPARAKLLGYWSGWMCPGAVGDVRVAIERIDGDDVVLHYAYASSANEIPAHSERIQARFYGDEVHAVMANGSGLVFRLRQDMNVDIMWWYGQTWCSGVLTSVPSPNAELTVKKLCGGIVMFALAGLDPREGVYLGSWRDLRSSSRLCAGLVIERFFDDDTAQIVYFYGVDPSWGARWPGYHRNRGTVEEDKIVNGSQTFELRDGKIYGTVARELPGTFEKHDKTKDAEDPKPE